MIIVKIKLFLETRTDIFTGEMKQHLCDWGGRSGCEYRGNKIGHELVILESR